MRKKFKIYVAIILLVVAATSASVLLNFSAVVKGTAILEGERYTHRLYHHLLLELNQSLTALYKYEAGLSLDLDALVEAVEEAEANLKLISARVEAAEEKTKIENVSLSFAEYKDRVSLVVTASSPERKTSSAKAASVFGQEIEQILLELEKIAEKKIEVLSKEISKKMKRSENIVFITVFVVIVVALLILLHIRSTIIAPFNRFILFLKDLAGSGDLSKRVDPPKDDDLATLAVSFNEMLSNLERQDLELKSSMEELEVSNEELQNSYINMEDLTTELEAKSQDLSDANEELKGMDRMKNEFMQNVSHELRTPLTPIVGYLELFINKDLGELDSVQTEIIGDMYQCGKRLGFVIDSLLEMVSLQEEQVTEKFEPIDVKSLFAEVEKIILEDIEDKKLSCKIECQESLQPVMGARKKMVLMLNHILKNAVKFTPEGGEIGFQVSSGDSGDIKFVISDNGLGICEDKLKSIFEPFLQLDSSTTRNFEGVGLGLALFKKVVDMHRGDISIESREDEGTTVTVHIPLA